MIFCASQEPRRDTYVESDIFGILLAGLRSLSFCLSNFRSLNFCFRFHLGLQVVITFDVRTARRTNLHEGKQFLIVRILLQKTLDCQEPLQNSLGVIDAIDADTHATGFDAQSLQQ